MIRMELLRRDAGLTTQQLGERAGVSGMTVRRIEAGRVQPYPLTVKALADALGAELDVAVRASELLVEVDLREVAA